MAIYNTSFFGALSTFFLQYKDRHGEEEALDFFEQFFLARLGLVYKQIGYEQGNPDHFARVVKKNDDDLGLDVSISAGNDVITYCFITDPFPQLKGEVDPEKWDRTYMRPKLAILLGDGWTYETVSHRWKGDAVTEHVIRR